MMYSSFLADDMTPLVLDTSVLINLHASTYGKEVLAALPNEILVPEIVVSELAHDSGRENGDYQFIQMLIATSTVGLIELDQREYDLFGSLVSGSPSLDDGESATIAVAICRSYLPVIDERKGRRQAQAHIPGKQPAWSLDLFRHPKVVEELGRELSIRALYLALRDGRMRIHESHCEAVVDLLGVQKAIDCTSLPGYKARREQWKGEKCQLSAEIGIVL